MSILFYWFFTYIQIGGITMSINNKQTTNNRTPKNDEQRSTEIEKATINSPKPPVTKN